MTDKLHESPADRAAREALAKLFAALDRGQSFVLEAGAGAGKTYSLVKALHYLIEKRGRGLLALGQQIACISYTNVASDEIRSRIDGHPVVWSSTIHAFAWSLISAFQPALRAKIEVLEGWRERLAEAGGIGARRVDYNLGHRAVADDVVLLGHDDVIKMIALLMEEKKFRDLLQGRFPVLLIDEYQDTNKLFAEAVVKHYLADKKGPLIGLFGDSWQKIYGDGCGAIRDDSLSVIGKGANFRSAPAIVNLLNAMRPELVQAVKDPTEVGSVVAFHTNRWAGVRRKGAHWDGDLPAAEATGCLEAIRGILAGEGWTFEPAETKILMLTHNVLAAEQGYSGIAGVLRQSELYVKKEDPYVGFLVDTVEPVCDAYGRKRFGEMFAALGGEIGIAEHADKRAWGAEMETLMGLRASGTIGSVIDCIAGSTHIQLSDKVSALESSLRLGASNEQENERVERAGQLRKVPYCEVIALRKFINESTPFATKHGVKGAEFSNVLVVVGRGWNRYDFNKMLEISCDRIPEKDLDFFERNRNLFYVACSRPKKRLAVLFTQRLSPRAVKVLTSWFGPENVRSLFQDRPDQRVEF